MKNLHKSKTGPLASLLRNFGHDERNRLATLLAAAPGGYCCFLPQGKIQHSESFSSILGLPSVTSLEDITNSLADHNAGQLEKNFGRLQNGGFPFRQTVQNKDGKAFIFTGKKSESPPAAVLWVEDVTDSIAEVQALSQEKTLLESERKKWLGALNALPRPVWVRDLNQDLIWCNSVYASAAGMDVKEVIAQQKELGQTRPGRKKKRGEVEPKQPGRDLAKMALEKGEMQKTQAHVIMSGARLLMNITEIPLADLGITLGLALDVTREEELEAQLRRQQTANHDLLEQLRTAIAVYSADTKLEFYNSAFAQLWDLDELYLNTRPKLGDIIEKLRETRRLPEQADFRKFKKYWMDMFTSLIEPHEEMMHLPDGTALRLLAVPHPMGGLMVTFEDVTSRLELESSYNTLIAVQKETLDNLAEAVAVFGGDGRLKLWNPAFGRLWDLNPEDLDGEPHITRMVEKLKGFFEKDDWPRRKEELIALALDRVMHEGRMGRVGGTLIDYTTVPLPDGGVLLTCTDVTDSVRVENALREKNAALEAAEKLKLDFLANVSYQLRTPLNAMMGFTEILDQEYFGPLNKRQKEYTGDIHKASQRLLELINDILDLSTIEAGYLKLHTEEVKIADLLAGIVDLMDGWARKEQISLKLSCPKNIGIITADGPRIKQAIINLIRNAIAFTREGGIITLSAKRRKDGIEIKVADTGIGIPKEDQARILRPFEKASAKKGRTERGGAGLGLSLVQSIVGLHGGEIGIESEPDKGTTVTLFLPFETEKQAAA